MKPELFSDSKAGLLLMKDIYNDKKSMHKIQSFLEKYKTGLSRIKRIKDNYYENRMINLWKKDAILTVDSDLKLSDFHKRLLRSLVFQFYRENINGKEIHRR